MLKIKDNVESSISNTSIYSCDICKKNFKRSSAYRGHMRFHTDALLDEKAHTREKQENSHKSYILLKSNDKETMAQALPNHNTDFENKEYNIKPPSELLYACDMCPNRFPKNAILKRHLLSHTGERPYKCDKCPATYRNKESLKNHQKVKHSPGETYKCLHCPFETHEKSTLTKHMRTHTNEKPFICSCCGLGYKSSSNLKMHLRTHTGEQPFQCDVCQRLFAYRSNMQSHRRRHSLEKPFKCTKCSMAFVDRASFKIHMRKHTGEKPYECHVCHRKFAHTSGLADHRRVHSGVRPHTCELCGKLFGRMAHLKVHTARVHKIKSPPSSLTQLGNVVAPTLTLSQTNPLIHTPSHDFLNLLNNAKGTLVIAITL